MRRLRDYWRDRRGAAAVEMAFVLPGFLFLLMGGSNLVFVTYANMCLNAATEAGARYASTYTVAHSGTGPATGTSSPVSTYAASIYKGPGIKNLAFDYETTGTCGGGNNKVTASGSYHLFYGIGNLSIAMNSTACYP